MSDYIEIRNIDFQQITIDDIPYSIERMEIVNDKAHLIYSLVERPITSIKVIKDRDKIIYKFVEE